MSCCFFSDAFISAATIAMMMMTPVTAAMMRSKV